EMIGAALEIRLKAAGYEVQVVTGWFPQLPSGDERPARPASHGHLYARRERFGGGTGIKERRLEKHSDYLHDGQQRAEPEGDSQKNRRRRLLRKAVRYGKPPGDNHSCHWSKPENAIFGLNLMRQYSTGEKQ